MTIQVLGSGCPNCKTLEANVKEALTDLNIEATVEKVTDMDKIVDMGVMMTPALAIDSEVLSTGKVLKKDEIIKILEKAKN